MQTVDQANLKQFEELGYVVIEGLLDLEEDVRPVVDEYSALLDSLMAQWHTEGKLSSTYRGLPFLDRLSKVIAESGQKYILHFDITLPQAAVTEESPMHHGPAVFNLLRSSRLLDAVECFIGPEIYSNPVQHVRVKPPERLLPEVMMNSLVSRTSWHQDQAVVDPEADDSDMLTVWIPITAATLENGCLVVEPATYKEDMVLHCMSSDPTKRLLGLHIPDQLIGHGTRPVPMQAGDVLFMHKLTKHSSLPNVSDDIRWSFDLRYNPTSQATGRPWFPGFVARSRAHPESEVTDPEVWSQLWRDARSRLANEVDPKFNRWLVDDPRCA